MTVNGGCGVFASTVWCVRGDSFARAQRDARSRDRACLFPIRSACGAHDRNRTDDLLLTMEMLYRLSYVGLRRPRRPMTRQRDDHRREMRAASDEMSTRVDDSSVEKTHSPETCLLSKARRGNERARQSTGPLSGMSTRFLGFGRDGEPTSQRHCRFPGDSPGAAALRNLPFSANWVGIGSPQRGAPEPDLQTPGHPSPGGSEGGEPFFLKARPGDRGPAEPACGSGGAQDGCVL
jgi:hypothetical protein